MEESNLNSGTSSALEQLSAKLEGWWDILILNLPNIAIALLVAMTAFFLSKYIRRLASKAASKFTGDRILLNLASNLAAIIFSMIAIFLILSIFDLDQTINKVLATAGVLGLAVGLALQDPMNNLFSGIFMSVRDLYKKGDLVETNGFFGTIINIDLRLTKLKLPGGEIAVIPNKDVMQNPLKNYTTSGERRVELSCGVSYGDDLENVEKIALETAESLPNIDPEKEAQVLFTEFGDSSINFVLRYWLNCTGQKDFLEEKSRGIKALKKAFDKNNISIPFPIRTLDFEIKGGKGLETVFMNSEKNMRNPMTVKRSEN